MDALHIALAVVHGIDYLMSWKCAHIANGDVMRRLARVNQDLGVWTPLIVTPEELSNPLEEGP